MSGCTCIYDWSKGDDPFGSGSVGQKLNHCISFIDTAWIEQGLEWLLVISSGSALSLDYTLF